ncbi:MAG TPA: VanW family protein [Anaerolineae bacterium]|nr:VanW family protein [Anaerolineae bacterium]HQK12997.1 VanW family protein [Anaerolineae bacterium]
MSRLLVILSVALLAAVMAVGWVLGPGMDQRLVPGVWIWNVPLGGMALSDAQAYLAAALPLRQPNILIVGPEGQRWSLSPADLGMSVDTQATLAQAYAVGHETKGSRKFSERLQIMLEGVMLPPVLAWNEQQTLAVLQTIAAELERSPQDARVYLEGTNLRLEPGLEGRRMDISATLQVLLPRLYALESVEIVPPLVKVTPQITDDKAAQALDMAHNVLAEPLILVVPDPHEGDPGPWTMTPDVMASMLRLTIGVEGVSVGLDEAALAQFLAPLAMALAREPVNATFRFDPDTITLIPESPSVMGRQMDVTASLQRINARLREGQHIVPLVVIETPPAYPDTVTAADLGIREVVAVGESYFTGSSSARDKNIRLGASKFDGIIILPGQTFSFNEYLGDVSPEAGYDESYVIIGNRTVLGVGGGICQVATTAFRAAYFGGYPIVERWPHAYRVGYYELGGYGPGFDATVYSPLVDFRFTNDTSYHILIHTEVDTARSRLRFVFYSTKTGRTVEQIGPTWGAPIPSTKAVYQYDPTLPAGTVVQDERPHDGLKATLGRIVRDADGKVLYEDTFVSNFIPWPARYRYGPGYTPPEGAEIVTPTP